MTVLVDLSANPFDTKPEIDPGLTVGFGSWLLRQADRCDNIGWLARRVYDAVRRGVPLPRNPDQLVRRMSVNACYEPVNQARHEYRIWLMWVREQFEEQARQEADLWATES